MIANFDKHKFLLFCVLFIAFSFLSYQLFQFLTIYAETTSFIWNEIANRNLPKENINLLILGDSQITSGIHPTLLREKVRKSKKNFDLFYYPRPSEQPEGILILTREFSKKFSYDTLLVNISPVTTSKNLISDSHRSLFQNFAHFSFEPFFDYPVGKYYFKNVSGGTYYFFLQVFPLLKLNSNFKREFAIISEHDFLKTESLEKRILPFFEGFEKNKSQNSFLKRQMINSEYYWEWGNFSDATPNCIFQTEPPVLPNGIEFAFLTLREDALNSWKKIVMEHKTKKVLFLYLPFAPLSEEKIGSKHKNSPIQVSLNALRLFKNVEIITPPENFFKSEEYKDYTHLNSCGMRKLNQFLSDYFSKTQ